MTFNVKIADWSFFLKRCLNKGLVIILSVRFSRTLFFTPSSVNLSQQNKGWFKGAARLSTCLLYSAFYFSSVVCGLLSVSY